MQAITKTNIKDQLTSWAIATMVALMIFMAMVVLSHADNTAVVTEIEKVAGKGSWVQKLMAVGSLAAGVTMMFKNHLVAGAGTVAGVWGALGIYNSGALF